MNENGLAVVMDNGSGMCKAGFAGEDAPTVPPVVGYYRRSTLIL